MHIVAINPTMENNSITMVDIVIANSSYTNSLLCNYWYDNCRTICTNMYGVQFNGVLTDPEVYNDSETGDDYIVMSLHL